MGMDSKRIIELLLFITVPIVTLCIGYNYGSVSTPMPPVLSAEEIKAQLTQVSSPQ